MDNNREQVKVEKSDEVSSEKIVKNQNLKKEKLENQFQKIIESLNQMNENIQNSSNENLKRAKELPL